MTHKITLTLQVLTYYILIASLDKVYCFIRPITSTIHHGLLRKHHHHRFHTYHKRVTNQLLTQFISNSDSDALTIGCNDEKPHIENVLLVECGFGNDSHGQNATKAAMRACRNAIEFNSLSINRMVPGGYDAMKLNVIVGVPSEYQHTLDLDQVKNVFPYGDIKFVVKEGGLVAPSGRIIESLGDRNDDMLIVAVAVQVGY